MVASPVDTVRSAVAALNGGEVSRYLGSFDPGCLRHVAGLEITLSLDEIAATLCQMADAFDDLTLHTESLFGTGEDVCARWRLEGVHVGEFLGLPASGRTVSVRTCEVYQVHDARVRQVWTYGDPLDLLHQIESLPERGSLS